MKKLVNGKLEDITTEEQDKILDSINKTNSEKGNENDPLDRIRITEDVKQELVQMVQEYPKTKVLLKILLGNSETNKLFKD